MPVVIVAVLVAAAVFAVVVVIVVILPATTVAIMVPVPVMVVLEVAAGTIPITGVETSTIVARTDPAGAFIRRASPIAAVPDIMAADRVPITIDPGVFRFGAGADRTDCIDARWRWRSDLNADGNLAECRGRSNKNRAREQ